MGNSRQGNRSSASTHSGSTSSASNAGSVSKANYSPPPMPQLDGNHMFTWKELAEADDLATAITVDCMLGFRTHKMFKEYPKLTRTQERRIRHALKEFRAHLDYERVYKEMMRVCLTTLSKWNADERFKLHVFRFLYLFDSRSGVEIRACKRYAHEGHVGAALYATATWEKGQRVTSVVGCIAELNLEEERNFLRPKENDFSVMFSSRKQCSQLWLGPAAYVNHDCKPNCQFNITCTGDCNMTMRVLRTIEPGDELLIYYGSHFFDLNNASCECYTCELLGRGNFSMAYSSGPTPTLSNATYEASRIHMDVESMPPSSHSTRNATSKIPMPPLGSSSNSEIAPSYAFRHTDSRLAKLRRTYSQVLLEQSGRKTRRSSKDVLTSVASKFLPSLYFRSLATAQSAVMEWRQEATRSQGTTPAPPKKPKVKRVLSTPPNPSSSSFLRTRSSPSKPSPNQSYHSPSKMKSPSKIPDKILEIQIDGAVIVEPNSQVHSESSSTLAPPPLLCDAAFMGEESIPNAHVSRKRRRTWKATHSRRRRKSTVLSKPPELQMQMPLLEAESLEDDVPPSPAELMGEFNDRLSDTGSNGERLRDEGTPTSGSGTLRMRIRRVTDDEYRVLPPLEHHEYTPPDSPPVLTTAV